MGSLIWGGLFGEAYLGRLIWGGLFGEAYLGSVFGHATDECCNRRMGSLGDSGAILAQGTVPPGAHARKPAMATSNRPVTTGAGGWKPQEVFASPRIAVVWLLPSANLLRRTQSDPNGRGDPPPSTAPRKSRMRPSSNPCTPLYTAIT